MIDKNPDPKRARTFRPKRLKTALAKPQAEVALPPAKDADRIAKVMARAGVASRREAEAWIEAGRVSVNGQAISSPALNVSASDRISIDGKPLPRKERTRLFLFHKPRGLVTTSADTHGRPTIFGALPGHLPRLVSVGRLDLNTEGLLLLTNDGGLARALELPSTGWLRRYRVRAYGKVLQPQLDGLRKGIEVDGVQYGAIEAALEREQGDNNWLTFAMREGKNREIRNVMRALGLQVNRLIRVSYGPFQLGELPAGAVEEVKTRTLREQLGEKLAALANADFSGPLIEREAPAPLPRETASRPRAEDRARPAAGPRSGQAAPNQRERPPAEKRGKQDRERSNVEKRGKRELPQSHYGDKGGATRHAERGEEAGRRDNAAPRHNRHRPHRGKHGGPRPSRPKGA